MEDQPQEQWDFEIHGPYSRYVAKTNALRIRRLDNNSRQFVFDLINPAFEFVKGAVIGDAEDLKYNLDNAYMILNYYMNALTAEDEGFSEANVGGMRSKRRSKRKSKKRSKSKRSRY